MAVGIIQDKRTLISVMYCTTEDRAFGPVFSEEEDPQEFLDWLNRNAESLSWAVAVHDGDGTDPRHYEPGELERVVNFWREAVRDAA